MELGRRRGRSNRADPQMSAAARTLNDTVSLHACGNLPIPELRAYNTIVLCRYVQHIRHLESMTSISPTTVACLLPRSGIPHIALDDKCRWRWHIEGRDGDLIQKAPSCRVSPDLAESCPSSQSNNNVVVKGRSVRSSQPTRHIVVIESMEECVPPISPVLI